jgi:PAS domain S-box-containing protein
MSVKAKKHLPLTVALLLTWWLTCWFATGAWYELRANAAYREEVALAESSATSAVTSYSRMIGLIGGSSRLLARDTNIQQALARLGSALPARAADEAQRRQRWRTVPDLVKTNRLLELAARDLGLDALVLLNEQGECVAASNVDSVLCLPGVSYRDREDVQNARAGRSRYLVSVGKKPDSDQLTFSAPVTLQGRFIGTVIGGNAMTSLANGKEQTDALGSDRHGVVLLSRDPPQRFAPWGDPRFPDLLRVPGRAVPALLRSRAIKDSGLSVSVLWPMPQLISLTQQRSTSALTLGTLGTLFMLLAAGYLSRRREQRNAAIVLEHLEQQARRAGDYLEQIANNITDPLYVKDREHRWVLVNRSFCRFWGQPRETFIGKTAHEVFSERETQRLWESDEHVLTSGIESVSEERLTDHQKTTHIVTTKKTPYTDTDGHVFLIGVMSDITERQRAERMAHTREREFRTLAENLPDIVTRYNCAAQLTYVSPALERLLEDHAIASPVGLTPVQIHPMGVSELEGYQRVLEHVLATGQTQELILPLSFPSSKECIYHVRVVAERLINGEISGALSIARDITERKRAEKKLKDTLAFKESIINAMPDLVWLKDVNGVYQFCNPAFTRATGVAESELVGRTDSHLFESDLAAHFCQKDVQVLETGAAYLNEGWVTYANNGHRTLLETRKLPVYGSDGKLNGVLGIARDITLLNEAELGLRTSEALARSRNELLQAIIESSPDIIVFALDAAYCYLAFNRKHQKMMQAIWGKRIEIGMNMLDVMGEHPVRQVAQSSMNRALGGESFVLEEAYGDEALSRQYWQHYWSPIRAGAGEVTGLTCFILNNSERKNAEEHMRRSHEILRALAAHKESQYAKQRKELAYQIHEDLAQNLTALRMNISVLEKSSQDGGRAQEFKALNEITERCIARIRDIVSVLRPTVLDLGLVPALHWLIEDFKGIGFHFDVELQEDLPLSDDVATVLFRAAQETLLNVALHAGATQVYVALEHVDDTCCLVVRDNGCGFDPNVPPRKDSFGLIGLTEQVRHMGGNVSINSQSGRGTEIRIQLYAVLEAMCP